MNETLRQLEQRKSVRVFATEPIGRKEKDAIIGAAFEAPTAGCMMLYSILDITDQDVKDRLAVLCDNQPFIAKAPMVLIFLADYQRWYDTYRLAGGEVRRPGPGDLLLAYSDAVIAAQNTVVAAESLGIGSCYIGDVLENCEAVRELLALPDYAVPAAMLVYGFPTQAQRDRRKPARFEREYVVFENRYHGLSEEGLLEMQRLRNAQEGREHPDLLAYLRAVCERKYASEFALEMNRSAAAYLAKFATR